MLGLSGRPDGMVRRPDGWQGTGFSDLQNLLKILLNSGIPCKRASLHTSDFVQTE